MEPVSDPRGATDFKQKGSISFFPHLYSPRQQDLLFCNIFNFPEMLYKLHITKKLSHGNDTVIMKKKKIKGKDGWVSG